MSNMSKLRLDIILHVLGELHFTIAYKDFLSRCHCEKIIEHLPVCILSSLLLAVWFEFILCFIRGYSELWYTILTAAVIVSVIATAFIVVGSELLIGFPDYTVYFAFVANGFALLFEIILIVYQIKEFCLKKRQDKKENAEL